MGCCASTKKKRSIPVGKAGRNKGENNDDFGDSDASIRLPPKSKSDPDVAPDFAEIHFISPEGCVVTMNRTGNHVWQCTRVDWEGNIKILLFYGPDHPEYVRKGAKGRRFPGWALCDLNDQEKDPICVEPAGNIEQVAKRPPLGNCWEQTHVNGKRSPGWSLLCAVPEQSPMEKTGKFDSPSCTVDYKCEENFARVIINMHKTPLTDESLEALLGEFKKFLCDLARRPEMILFWTLDLQGAPPMSRKHINRFMEWIDAEGLPLRLLVRGSVIKLDASGFIGMAVQGIVRFILKLKPPPWPSQVVPNEEEAKAFIDKCLERARSLCKESKKGNDINQSKDISNLLSKHSQLSDCLNDMDEKPVPIVEFDRQADNQRCQPCVCTLFDAGRGD